MSEAGTTLGELLGTGDGASDSTGSRSGELLVHAAETNPRRSSPTTEGRDISIILALCRLLGRL